MTGASYPEIRRSVAGVLLSVGLGSNGVITRGALFVLRQLGSAASLPEVQVVKIDLRSDECRTSAVFEAEFPLDAALGELWLLSGTTLVELSTRDLTVIRRIPIGPLGNHVTEAAGQVWTIVNGRLETLPAGRSRFVAVSLPWMNRSRIDSLAGNGSTLYLTSTVASTGEAVISAYEPGTGAHREAVQQEAGFYGLTGASAHVLWVNPPGGMADSVWAYSESTLQPLPSGFRAGGINGEWSAALGSGDLLYENVGQPLECVSGVTGQLTATLEVPGQLEAADTTDSVSPAFLGAGESVLAVAASSTAGNPPEDRGIALYVLDPHCRS